MPRILELKEIDGALWARLDVDMANEPPPVGLYTSAEEDRLKYLARRDGIQDCIEALPGGQTCDPQHLADTFRGLIETV
mgnify:CR=1 FL=1